MLTRAVRPGQLAPWLAAVLLALFAVLTTYHALVREVLPTPGLHDALLDAEILAEPALATTDWPQWRGPRRDGVSDEKGLLRAWPADGPRVLWRAKAGPGFSGVAVASGRAITHFREGGDEVVAAWDAATGNPLWRHAYPCTFNEAARFSAGPRSTPAADEGRVVTLGASGILLGLDAATGAEVWRHDLMAELSAPEPQWGFTTSPLLDAERVYIMPGGSGGALAAFDRATGQRLWSTGRDPAGYSSPILFTAGGVRQVVFFTGNALTGVTPDHGKVLWRFPWETSFHVNAATPIAFRARTAEGEGDYLFITSSYNKGCALVKVEPDGEGGCRVKLVYEAKGMQAHFATPVRVGAFLYGSSDPDPGMLVCFDLRGGEVRWRQRGYGKGGVLAVDGMLLIQGDRGKVALAEATPEAYRELARWQPFKERAWTLPTLASGRLYLRNEEEVICAALRER
jgi:outer membrane protein assembly factor BamB